MRAVDTENGKAYNTPRFREFGEIQSERSAAW